jgi:hypothetical protein
MAFYQSIYLKEKCIIFFLLFCIYIPCNAQKEKQIFSNASAVYTLKSVHVFYDKKGDSISLHSEHIIKKKFLDDESCRHVNQEIFYSGFNGIENIKGRTVCYQGDKQKTYNTNKYIEHDVMIPGVFYDDAKSKEVLFFNVTKGSITELTYKSSYKEPRIFSPVMLSSEIPVLLSVVKVTMHKDIHLSVKFLSIDESQIKHEVSVDKDYITHTWSVENLPAIKHEMHAPAIRYSEPQIAISVSDVLVKGEKKCFASEVNDLYKWLSHFAGMTNNQLAALKPLADSIVHGSLSDKEKSERIFYWVQNHIKYIAFEAGYGGFVPRNANDVYIKRYGDCKDMANLITTLHKIVGLDAYIAWIGTRDIPYRLEELPMPCAFDHMISAVYLDTQWHFLDATGSYMPYGLPTSMIQGKQALVGISKDSGLVLTVPVTEMNMSATTDTIQIWLENNVVRGDGHTILTGYNKYKLQAALKSRNQDAAKKYLHSFLTLGNNKCTISSTSSYDIPYATKEQNINYSFVIPDYALHMQDEIYINLNLEKELANLSINEKERKQDYIFDFKNKKNQVIAFSLPEGYTVAHMPTGFSYHGSNFNVSITYVLSGNIIIYQKKIELDTISLSPEEIKDWNQMIHELNLQYKETVALKKK